MTAAGDAAGPAPTLPYDWIMFRYFETLLPGAVPPPQQARRSGPPAGLLAFYWHFIRQAKPVFAAMFATSFGIALIDTLLPVLIGRLVDAGGGAGPAGRPAAAWPTPARHRPGDPGRPAAGDPARQPGAPLRRDPGRHADGPLAEPLARGAPELAVLPERLRRPHRQPRDADRLRGARNAITAGIRSVWYIFAFGGVSLGHHGRRRLAAGRADAGLVDRRLPVVPVLVRPAHARARPAQRRGPLRADRPHRRQLRQHPHRQAVRPRPDEDAYVAKAIDDHRRRDRRAHAPHHRLHVHARRDERACWWSSTAATGIGLWVTGEVGAGVVAMALPLAWQIANMAGWVSWEIAGIFENIGTVQEGMQTIAVPARARRPRRRAASWR